MYQKTADVIPVRIAIIGAGPTGLFIGAALARRGHQVTAVERDPGPAADGSWPRLGVMQFHHAHAFRHQVVQALEQELPEALQEWVAGGAEPVQLALPDGSQIPMGCVPAGRHSSVRSGHRPCACQVWRCAAGTSRT